LLLAVLLLAFFATKTCASREGEMDPDEAEEIAKEQVDFEPEKVVIKGVRQGLDSHLFWYVSLTTQDAEGRMEMCVTVRVDSETAETETLSC
jgi:hypothetical protein